MKRRFPMLALLVLVAAPAARAQVPQLVSYQGVLTDDNGAIVADGSYSFTFRIFVVSSGGAALYQETQNGVLVQRGGFSVLIGAVTALTLPFDEPYWLEMQVGADDPLAPRVPLTSGPYALMAETVLDNAITSAKIANNTIVSLDVLDNTLTAADIAAGAVTTSEILDGTIGVADIGVGAVTSSAIGLGAVTSSAILDGTVVAADIADEPGTAYDLSTATVPLSFPDVTVSSITLNAPAAGYIIVSVSGYFAIVHNIVGQTCTPRVSISESSAFDFNSMTLYEQVPNANTRTYNVPFARSQAYFKAAPGSYTFHLVANLFDNAVTTEDACSIKGPEIHAIYLPTAYGTISQPNAPQYSRPDTADGR